VFNIQQKNEPRNSVSIHPSHLQTVTFEETKKSST